MHITSRSVILFYKTLLNILCLIFVIDLNIHRNGSKIQKATGENLGLCIFLLISSVIAVGNAFYHGWFLTLSSLFFVPFLAWVTYFSIVLEERCVEEQDVSYAEAGSAALQALGNITTVAAYGGEIKEIERYEKALGQALDSGLRRGKVLALGLKSDLNKIKFDPYVWFTDTFWFFSFSDGLTFLIYYASTAFTLWLGTILIFEFRDGNSKWGKSNPESTLIVRSKVQITRMEFLQQTWLFFCQVYLSLMMSAYEFGEGISYFILFSDGCVAAAGLHYLIDRVSEIDPLDESGTIPDDELLGNIEIKNVQFSYPSRPSDDVIKGMNISLKAGQTVALVGHSGCGKSTLVQLLQRFYDPDKGQVCKILSK